MIIGASGHGKVVADVALKMNKWEYIAFLDQDENVESTMGIKMIYRSENALKYLEDYNIFVVIGDNTPRKRVSEELMLGVKDMVQEL